MATGGVLGNVRFAYSSTSPVSWMKITNIRDADIPGLEPSEVETTVYSTGKLKRHMPGLSDVSDCTLTLVQDLDETTSAEQAALLVLQQAGTTVWCRAEIANDRAFTKWTAFEFQAYVKTWKPSAKAGALGELQVVFRFDGDSFTKYPSGASVIGA